MKQDQMVNARFPHVVQSSVARVWISLFVLIVVAAGGAVAQSTNGDDGIPQAGIITAIYDFGAGGSTDPLNPQSVGVISQGRDGNMWSTTPKGGMYGIGAAFKITPAGKMTKVHDFNPNATTPEGTPESGLTLGTDGNFYGTMFNGGTSNNGAVFKMTPAGVVTILYSFTGGNDGKNPDAPPVEGADGNFYGTTYSGGLANVGTVYWMTPAGKLTTCVSFTGSDGQQPYSPLFQATDRNFYGTTSNNDGYGTVFTVTPAKACAVTTLYGFNDAGGDGAYPNGVLVQGSDGNLYSSADEGSSNNFGLVYNISPQGKYTEFFGFDGGTNGGHPVGGLLLATDGNWYGVTNVGGADKLGTLYQLAADGKTIQVWAFNGQNGANPDTTPIQNTNGTIYGDTPIGGAQTNTGTFYKFIGLKFEKTPFVSLLPTSGKIGKTIDILGQGFTTNSKVYFNGAKAKSHFVSATFMTANVPMGATSGFVTVTTPKRKLTSNRQFQVTK
jgi:uncharacterized repeat protein (TIGR03803 family)